MELGHFIDDPNKKLNDKIESLLPDEPIEPAIDRFCKDQVKIKEEVIFNKDLNENASPVDHELSSKRSTTYKKKTIIDYKHLVGLSISSSFKDNKISNKSIKSIGQQSDHLNIQKIQDSEPADAYKDGISGKIFN